MSGNKFLHIIKENLFIKSFMKFIKDDGFEHAGYIAFLNIFAVIPLFMILISVLSLLYETKSGIEIIKNIINLLPDYALSIVRPQIDSIFIRPSTNLLSFVFLGTIWTTSSSLEGMRTIFNKVYKVKDPPFFLVTRLISILQFFFLIFCTIVLISIFIILPKILSRIQSVVNVSLPTFGNYYLNYIFIFLVLTIVINITYYFLINKKILFIETLPGSILTVCLWYLSISMFSYYLSNLADFNIVYGSLAGVIITLLFFYIINIILIYGAEVNYIFKKSHPNAFDIYIKFWRKTSKTLPFQNDRDHK